MDTVNHCDVCKRAYMGFGFGPVKCRWLWREHCDAVDVTHLNGLIPPRNFFHSTRRKGTKCWRQMARIGTESLISWCLHRAVGPFHEWATADYVYELMKYHLFGKVFIFYFFYFLKINFFNCVSHVVPIYHGKYLSTVPLWATLSWRSFSSKS